MPKQRDHKADGAKRLTDAEHDRIIELKIDGRPVKYIADQVGCRTETVKAHWDKHIKDATELRITDLEGYREAQIQRLSANAALSWQTAKEQLQSLDGSVAVARQLLHAHVQAENAVAKLAGLEAPKVVQLSATHVMTAEEAEAILAEDT